MSEKRFRGLHYHFDGSTYHIWIYSREKELLAMIQITGNKIWIHVGELEGKADE